MGREHIKPSSMLNFRAILYSPTHLFMSFNDRHILMLNIVTYWDRLSGKGVEEPYRSELLLQKLHS